MPRIFDNIDQQLLPSLKTTLSVSHRSDFCVGYFNLRGWRQLDEHIENWSGGEGECCRLLVGMQTLPQQEIAEAYGIIKQDADLDNQTALRLKKALAEQFRLQLTLEPVMNFIPAVNLAAAAVLFSRSMDGWGSSIGRNIRAM